MDSRIPLLKNMQFKRMLSLVVLGLSLLCIFPPEGEGFQLLSEWAVWVALFWLVCGLLLLATNHNRLMFVFFGCSASIAFWINETRTPGATGYYRVDFYTSEHKRSTIELYNGLMRKRHAHAIVLESEACLDTARLPVKLTGYYQEGYKVDLEGGQCRWVFFRKGEPVPSGFLLSLKQSQIYYLEHDNLQHRQDTLFSEAGSIVGFGVYYLKNSKRGHGFSTPD